MSSMVTSSHVRTVTAVRSPGNRDATDTKAAPGRLDHKANKSRGLLQVTDWMARSHRVRRPCGGAVRNAQRSSPIHPRDHFADARVFVDGWPRFPFTTRGNAGPGTRSPMGPRGLVGEHARRGKSARPPCTPPGRVSDRSGQLWPSKRLVTEPSLNTSVIARAISGAIDKTVSLSIRLSCAIGSVLVTTISSIFEFFS